MLMMLLRRLLHKKNWNSTENGLPHNPVKSGVHYIQEEKDFELVKAFYHTFLSLSIALLSGDLRKPVHRQIRCGASSDFAFVVGLFGQDCA